jgi:NDP-sugar pyrophosphorylase family protein
MKKLVIIGAGDLSLDLVENIERDKLYKIHGFIDKKKKGMYCGYPILSKDINDVKNAEKYCYFVSIADNKSRKEIIDILLRKKLNVVSIICKDSFISKHAKIGKNVYIGKRVTINANAYIGNNNIIRDNC